MSEVVPDYIVDAERFCDVTIKSMNASDTTEEYLVAAPRNIPPDNLEAVLLSMKIYMHNRVGKAWEFTDIWKGRDMSSGDEFVGLQFKRRKDKVA